MIHISEWKWHLNYIPVNLSIYLNVLCLFMKRDALLKVLPLFCCLVIWREWQAGMIA